MTYLESQLLNTADLDTLINMRRDIALQLSYDNWSEWEHCDERDQRAFLREQKHLAADLHKLSYAITQRTMSPVQRSKRKPAAKSTEGRRLDSIPYVVE